MSVKILSDSSCDLPRDLAAKYGVQIVPLHIVLGDTEYADGALSPEEIYAWSDANKATPKTSALGLEEAVNVFKPIVEAGDEIVIFALSSSMSTTCNVMRIASGDLDTPEKVHVIDSQNLSTGIALQVLIAAEMANAGKSAQEIVDFIAGVTPRVRSSFVVDTLTYLHRGGRCSGVAALAGAALKMHPKIAVVDGKMGAGKKYRGVMKKVILDYAKDLEPELLTADTKRVFITHSGCDEAIIAEVKVYLESLNRFEEILVARAGGAISSHCGPGTLGVLFIAGE